MSKLVSGHGLFETEEQVLGACARALRLAPIEYPPTLEPCKELAGAPAWYSFEMKAWPIGESVRLSFVERPRFRSSYLIQAKVLEVATCRNLRRGRQSFVMALAFKAAAQHAEALAEMLPDPDVDGQVIDTLLKMRASGFTSSVKPLLLSNQAWIRKLTRRYVERYAA